MYSPKRLFTTSHNPLLLDDFAVLGLDDLDRYTQNKFYNWSGEHLFLAVYCDDNHLIRGVKTIGTGHNARCYKPLSIILSMVDHIHAENVYLVHMFDHDDFVSKEEILSISKRASMLLKSSGHKVCGHLLYVGNDVNAV